MYLTHLKIQNHPILKDVDLDLINPKTKEPYAVVAFVGENGCGKTTLLNEIHEYDRSKYIIEKEKPPFSVAPHLSLFLRQNSLIRNAFQEIGKYIDGNDRYTPYDNAFIAANGLKTPTPLEDKDKGLEILNRLDDIDIFKAFKENRIEDAACGLEITKLIRKPGSSEYDISKYSSGQQEILLKLKDLKKYVSGTDAVLLDEPETSLHPRWQKEIVSLLQNLLKDTVNTNSEIPQFFIATHSEKILESLVKRDDALIVRLFKNKGSVVCQKVDQMELVLPKPTFAELDYVIFGIPSFDYHDQLLSRYGVLIHTESTKQMDRYLSETPQFRQGGLAKTWEKKGKYPCTYETLPLYIRNWSHHPKDGLDPTEEELKRSIDFLRDMVK